MIFSRLPRVVIIAVTAACLLVAPAYADSPAEERAREVQATAAEELRATPESMSDASRCAIGFLGFERGVAYTLPSTRDAGLHVGDIVRSIDGVPFPSPDSVEPTYFSKHTGELVTVIVVRNGGTEKLSVPCVDQRPARRAQRRALEMIVGGNWKGCLAAIDEAESLAWPSSYFAMIRQSCGETDRWLRNRQADLTDGTRVYELFRRRIYEAKFQEDGLSRIRADVIAAATVLRGYGQEKFAADLEALFVNATKRPELQGDSVGADEAGSISTGTCFAVGPDGLILTAHHVVAGSQRIRIRFGDGRFSDAVVLKSSGANDIALLRSTAATPNYLTLAKAGELKIALRVFTFGYPATDVLGADVKFTEGSVSALTGPGGEASLLQISVPVQPGNSGGPLIGESGRVVGIVTSTAAPGEFLEATGSLPQNVNWAVNAEYARPLFTPPPPVPAAASREEAVTRAKRATCFVEVTSKSPK